MKGFSQIKDIKFCFVNQPHLGYLERTLYRFCHKSSEHLQSQKQRIKNYFYQWCGDMQSKKNILLPFFLCLILGHLGVHRFYLKRYWTGVFMLCSLGGLGLWYLVDLGLILSGKLTEKKTKSITRFARI